ncbi:unnamed protein product [Paramecium primaurelia]|uniref:Transmembrane protein n=1 Tax=Paramecium primaurelia TaxID=5886 RepID=A0A8S1N3A2_PARPR|nr:unnamed protein product [Paramecium primaurelia]
MSKTQLFKEMVIIIEEMKNIYNRILTTKSSKIFDYPSIQNRNEKIIKYCHQMVDLNPKQFNQYFISEQYIDELLNRMDHEKLLNISLKFIVKYIYNKDDEQSQQNVEKLKKIIRDIDQPKKTKIIRQSQLFDQNLRSIHKSSQTLTKDKESQSIINLNFDIHKQSSKLSSIQQDNLNTHKFNDKISIKKDKQKMNKLDQQSQLQSQKLNNPFFKMILKWTIILIQQLLQNKRNQIIIYQHQILKIKDFLKKIIHLQCFLLILQKKEKNSRKNRNFQFYYNFFIKYIYIYFNIKKNVVRLINNNIWFDEIPFLKLYARKFKISRPSYIAFLIVLLGLACIIFRIGRGFFIKIMTLIYPFIMTLEIIETQNYKNVKQWLSYWIIVMICSFVR